jgi:hypothetical protein
VTDESAEMSTGKPPLSGVVSIVLSVVSISIPILTLVFLVAAGVGHGTPTHYPIVTGLTLFSTVLSGVAAMVGLALGVRARRRAPERKALCVVGIASNALVLGLFLVGWFLLLASGNR